MSFIGPQKAYLGDSTQTGMKRILRASVLERFPTFDRSYCSMPEELVDFFFDNKERIIVKKGENEFYQY
jgi:hypothetical protein